MGNPSNGGDGNGLIYLPYQFHRVVAGNAAMVIEYFNKGYYPSGAPSLSDSMQPMGALVKAILINSGTEMTGKEAHRQSTKFPNMDQVRTVYNALKRSMTV